MFLAPPPTSFLGLHRCPVTRPVHWSRASASRPCLLLIGCSKTRTVSSQHMMYTNAAVQTRICEMKLISDQLRSRALNDQLYHISCCWQVVCSEMRLLVNCLSARHSRELVAYASCALFCWFDVIVLDWQALSVTEFWLLILQNDSCTYFTGRGVSSIAWGEAVGASTQTGKGAHHRQSCSLSPI